MKRILIFAAAVSLLTACGEIDSSTPETPPEEMVITEIITIDTADLVREIYDGVVARLGAQELPTPEVPTGEIEGAVSDMGQIVNCEYVCGYINQKWGTSIVPVAGTEKQAANMEYVLRMVDLANSKRGVITSYGTGSYATKQAADTVATNECVKSLVRRDTEFIAIGWLNGINFLFYSTNARDWMPCDITFSYTLSYFKNSINNVTYGINASGDLIFIAGHSRCSETGNRNFISALYSYDGKNWQETPVTEIYSPYGLVSQGVTYAGRRNDNIRPFFIRTAPNMVLYSYDGIEWDPQYIDHSYTEAAYKGPYYDPDNLIMLTGVQGEDTRGSASSKGNKYGFQVSNFSLPNKVVDNFTVAYGNGRYVAVGDSQTDSFIFTSTDGINWTSQEVSGPSGLFFVGLVYGGTWWLGSYFKNGKMGIAISTNGTDWDMTTFEDNWQAATYGRDILGGDAFIIVGENKIATTTVDDPYTLWVILTVPGMWRSVAYGNGKWVAVASDGVIGTSPDGENWTTTALAGDWTGVAFVGGRFVAVAHPNDTMDNSIATSTDGENWTVQNFSGIWNTGLQEAVYGNGRWMAGGYNGVIATSTDGINWTTQEVCEGDDRLMSIVYVNSMWMALIRNGGYITTVLTSKNGTEWTETQVFPGYPNNVMALSMTSIGRGIGITASHTAYFFTYGIEWDYEIAPVINNLKVVDKLFMGSYGDIRYYWHSRNGWVGRTVDASITDYTSGNDTYVYVSYPKTINTEITQFNWSEYTDTSSFIRYMQNIVFARGEFIVYGKYIRIVSETNTTYYAPVRYVSNDDGVTWRKEIGKQSTSSLNFIEMKKIIHNST
jgi:hypothetical protein